MVYSTSTESESEAEADVPLSPAATAGDSEVPQEVATPPSCSRAEQPGADTKTTTTNPDPPQLPQPVPDVNNNTEVNSAEAAPSYTWEDVQCPICLDPLMDTLVANCSHRFCKFCIKRWFRTRGQSVCPVCRSDVASITPSRELDAATEQLAPAHLSETQRRERAVIRRVRQFDEMVVAEGLMMQRPGPSAIATPVRHRRSPSYSNIFERSRARWQAAQTTAQTQTPGTSVENRPETAASRPVTVAALETTSANKSMTTNAGSTQPESATPTSSAGDQTETSESARRIRWIFEVEEVANQFEMCVLRARRANELRLSAERDLNENMRRVERLYERFATLGVLTSRDEVDEIRPASAFPSAIPYRNGIRHGATQAGGGQARNGNDDPVAAMYQELDDVFGEAIFAEQSIRQEEQHAARARAMDRIAVFNTDDSSPPPLETVSWPYDWNNGYGHPPQQHHYHNHHGQSIASTYAFPSSPTYETSWPAAGTGLNRWPTLYNRFTPSGHLNPGFETDTEEEEIFRGRSPSPPRVYPDRGYFASHSIQTAYEGRSPPRGRSRTRRPTASAWRNIIRQRADDTERFLAETQSDVVNLTEQAAVASGHRARRRAVALPNERNFSTATPVHAGNSRPSRPLSATRFTSTLRNAYSTPTPTPGDQLRSQFLQRNSFHTQPSASTSNYHTPPFFESMVGMYADMELELTESETQFSLEDAARGAQEASRHGHPHPHRDTHEYIQQVHPQDREAGSGSEQEDTEAERAHHSEVERQLRHLFQTYNPEGDGNGNNTAEDVEQERNFTQFLLDGETLHEYEAELHEYQNGDEDETDVNRGGSRGSGQSHQDRHHEHAHASYSSPQYFQPSQHLPRPPQSAISAANGLHRSCGTYHFHHDGSMHAGYFTMESTLENDGEARFHVLDEYGNHATVASGPSPSSPSFHNSTSQSSSRASTAFDEGYQNGDASQ